MEEIEGNAGLAASGTCAIPKVHDAHDVAMEDTGLEEAFGCDAVERQRLGRPCGKQRVSGGRGTKEWAGVVRFH
jgi:hypothetical protein